MCSTVEKTSSIMSHGILRYFKSNQPTPEETGLTSREVDAANKAVQKVIGNVNAGASSRGGQKRKYTTTFTAEDRAQIGKYAAENVLIILYGTCIIPTLRTQISLFILLITIIIPKEKILN